MTDSLLEAVLDHDDLAELDPGARRLAIRNLLAASVAPADLAGSIKRISDAIDGFGPLSDHMRDPQVTDILVNGPDEVWVERAGVLRRSDVAFDSESELHELVDRLLGATGSRADLSHPLADARLIDGSRIHVALPPVAPSGPLVSIRRFPPDRLSMPDLVGSGMLQEDQAAALCDFVRARRTIVISGATGSGKTTLLNALLAYVGPDRVVVIEETAELRPDCEHWVSLVAREANVEGSGEIALGALVRVALRMRPDRIVVGEVRGPEALAALGALSSGHEGSLLSIHARSAEEALERLASLSLLAAPNLDESSLSGQFQRAVDVVVQLHRHESGTRRVAAVVELD